MIETERGPLPIHFFTIVVKAGAVERSFPGGREEFIKGHDPASYNGALFCLSVMGPESVEWHLTRLEAASIVLGVDAALADMTHGPNVECPGLVFACEGEWFGARWTVDANQVSNMPEEDVHDAPEESVQRLATRLRSCPAQGPEAPPAPPTTAWRRRVIPGGLVFWSGGDEDE